MINQAHGSLARVHSLDALRAFALLLGIVFHSTLAYRLPPQVWAVGTDDPPDSLIWFVYYAHSFRMAAFFLMAGYFAKLIVDKRGEYAFLRDRGKRILLVFALLLYPMRYLCAAAWTSGGLRTGWLDYLPPDIRSLPIWRLAHLGLQEEHFPDISLTHLWFLYYLAIISGLFIAVRWLLLKIVMRFPNLVRDVDMLFRRIVSGRFAPLWLALPTTPLIAQMTGLEIDTPDHSLTWAFPVILFYSLFFSAGWWLQRQPELLDVIAARWKIFLFGGLAVSVVSLAGLWIRYDALPEPGLRWATSFTTALTTSLSVLGWLGLFVRVFNRPSIRIRYMADASYWLYLAHLPVVVGLQVWLSTWDAHWSIKVLVINAITFTALIAVYHFCVRFTWIGTWLNGPRYRNAALAAEPA